MTKLSKNFTREEFACRCGCGTNTVDHELVTVLQDIADHFQDVIYITSGIRCENHNKNVGGSPNSQHLLGRAADIKAKHHDPSEVQEYLQTKYPTQYGVGSYESFTHIDTRSNRARWKG